MSWKQTRSAHNQGALMERTYVKGLISISVSSWQDSGVGELITTQGLARGTIWSHLRIYQRTWNFVSHVLTLGLHNNTSSSVWFWKKQSAKTSMCFHSLRNDSDFPHILIVALLQPVECVLNICFMISSSLLQTRRNTSGISQDDSSLFSTFWKFFFFFFLFHIFRFLTFKTVT